MKLVLQTPFDFKGVSFLEIELSDRIRVKERRIMEKLESLSETDALLSLCASICDMEGEVFDQIGDDDFERITQHVIALLEKRAEKKSPAPAVKRRSRNRKGRAADAPRVRVQSKGDA